MVAETKTSPQDVCSVNYVLMYHGDLTWKLRNKINNFCLCGPRLHLPDISDSSLTVHLFVQVVHILVTDRLVGRSNKILTVPISICHSC